MRPPGFTSTAVVVDAGWLAGPISASGGSKRDASAANWSTGIHSHGRGGGLGWYGGSVGAPSKSKWDIFAANRTARIQPFGSIFVNMWTDSHCKKQ